MRLGVAGKIMSAKRAAELLDQGFDFVLLGRAGTIEPNFPLKAMANPAQRSLKLPVMAEYLRYERFINHLRSWQAIVYPNSP